MGTEQVSKPTSLPPYPQMIFAAIDGLKQKEGLNKSSISNFMESTYGVLPAGHIALLTQHLNNLKESGELVFVKNNYMRPDPNTPLLKRGRGRPPKAKDPNAVETLKEVLVQGESGSEVKRGRGRPKKDPNTPSEPKKVKVSGQSGSGRGRGRPRKVQPEFGGVEAI
ncbi:HMG-Y-related protein A-like [Rutidosis leptorrhynchoides]|uniref:HMG-Y-related protein A-like n=1 Tax=Rutidosis leptorrhynchoides TaxID=125765 RepID=UPI003A9A080C